MVKIYYLLSFLIFLTILLFYLPLTSPILADLPSCQNQGITIDEIQPTYISNTLIKFTLKILPDGDFGKYRLNKDYNYDVTVVPSKLLAPQRTNEFVTGTNLATGNTFVFTFSNGITDPYDYRLEVDSAGLGRTTVESICTGPSFKVIPYNPFAEVSCNPVFENKDNFFQEIEVNQSQIITLNITPNITPRDLKYTFSFLIYPGNMQDQLFKYQTKYEWQAMESRYKIPLTQNITGSDTTKNIPAFNKPNDDYTLVIKADTVNDKDKIPYSWGCTVKHFKTVNTNPSTIPAPGGAAPGAGAPSIPAATACTDPKTCSSGGGDPCNTEDGRGPAMKTAIGCIHTNPAELAKDLMTFVIGISGGIAFLLMVMGAFQMLTSAGNPDHLNAGRERLTNAVIGLLFIIFAILFLQIIGIGILAIPGFK